GTETADEPGPRQREIAHRIQRLVPHELVGIAQPLHVDDAIVVADHEGILQRRPQRIACRPEPLDIPKETEGPRPGDLPPEYVGVDIAGEALPADRRAVEIDLDLEPRAVMGLELGPGGAVLDAYGLQ